MTGPAVIVVGGGIVGLSVAYHLVGRGGRVDLIDAGDGPSATSRAALGVLTHSNGGDSPYARLYRDGHRGFEELADRLRHEVGVDIGWRPLGGMDLCFSEVEEEEAEASRRFNLSRGCQVEWLDGSQVRALEPQINDRVRSGLYFPDDHRVDPEGLAAGLRAGIAASGGRVHQREVAHSLLEAANGIDLQTSRGRRRADFLVLAAGSWSGELGARFGYDIGVRPVRGQHGRFASAGAAAHVVRGGGLQSVAVSGAVIVGSTTEETGFDAATTAGAMDVFHGYWRQVFATPPQPQGQRAGLRPKPRGGRPMIGPLPGADRVFAATGHYKIGILLGPLTGRLIAEWIVDGRPSRPMDVFGVRGAGGSRPVC